MLSLPLVDGPLVYVMICVVLTLVFQWWYRSRKLDIRYEDTYVLITGCDTGFGNGAAVKFDQLGFNVFAGCYSAEKMEELSSKCSPKLCPFHLDVSSDASVNKALEIVTEKLPPNTGIWAVVNNAGLMGTVGPVEWLEKKHYKQTLSVNLLGMMAVTKAFLPLVRVSHGRVVLVSSVLGRFPITPAPYAVSKSCVEAWGNRLRLELWDQDVSVHLIEPGGYRTNLTDATLLVKSLEKSYQELNDDLKIFYGEKYTKKLYDLMTLTRNGVWGKNLEEVVDAYVHAVTSHHPKARYVVGLNGNLLFRPMWMLPTRLADFLVGMSLPQPAGFGQAS
ncbi:hypothetical protein RRG08_059960 [Elysia crispata]|uniref:Uncharacterized protein n=1 Tax=Elysia crispata TaxID=231223 RepID=A0AAE1CU38_9GAST|nr:hypothetical protein RRG08_059960 [Elysia crispata]